MANAALVTLRQFIRTEIHEILPAKQIQICPRRRLPGLGQCQGSSGSCLVAGAAVLRLGPRERGQMSWWARPVVQLSRRDIALIGAGCAAGLVANGPVHRRPQRADTRGPAQAVAEPAPRGAALALLEGPPSVGLQQCSGVDEGAADGAAAARPAAAGAAAKDASAPRDSNILVRGATAIAPSIVNITVDPPRDHRWRKSSVSVAADASTGSGCLVQATGASRRVILTNAHVVHRAFPPSAEGPAVWVTLSDGRRMEAHVLQLDATNDLAVVKLKGEHKHLPPAATLATPARLAALRVGEWVVAGGSPLSLRNTVTHGIVSAIGRERREIGGDPTVKPRRWGYIQTDAAINNGNSGGPLAVIEPDGAVGGVVVGVNTMRASGASGISFATPVSSQDLDELLLLGKLARPFLGINLQDLNEALIDEISFPRDEDEVSHRRPRSSDGMPRDYSNSGGGGEAGHEPLLSVGCGVLIRDVVPHSPADRAGLRAGDIITDVNDIAVKTATDVLHQVGTEIGTQLRFKYMRLPTGSIDSDGSRNGLHVATAVTTTEAEPPAA
jgi:S1-C subfamily serine protease